MSFKTRHRATAVAALSLILSACGGGSDTPALSANQQAFENLSLAPASGSVQVQWNLNYSGPQISGTNYAFSETFVMAASPLTNGPQTVAQTGLVNMTAGLPLVTPAPQRILKNGAILVVPSTGLTNRVSYVGADVQVESLAADKSTVAYTVVRSNYQTVPLAGALSTTPTDFAQYFNSFSANPLILNATATYKANAAYVKFTQTNKGDRYNAGDCGAVTTDANVSPCPTTQNLTGALTTGINSNSDGVTYKLADGAISTVSGVPIWVANAPRPQVASMSSTVQYRIYFELNGKVYTGAMIKDGAVMGGSYYVSKPDAPTAAERLTFLNFHIRMNKAALDSVQAAMKI